MKYAEDYVNYYNNYSQENNSQRTLSESRYEFNSNTLEKSNESFLRNMVKINDVEHDEMSGNYSCENN